MSIPGGCFVAPKGVRRLNQLKKNHAHEAKLKLNIPNSVMPGTPPMTPPASPAIPHRQVPQSLIQMATSAPLTMFNQTRSTNHAGNSPYQSHFHLPPSNLTELAKTDAPLVIASTKPPASFNK